MSNKKTVNTTILGLSVLELTLVTVTILSLAVTINFSRNSSNLTTQLSETGIQLTIEENAELLIENQVLKDQLLGLQNEIDQLRDQLRSSELEHVTVRGVVEDHIFKNPLLGNYTGIALEIHFESLNRDLIGKDVIESREYEVELKNNYNYVVKIQYTTRFFKEWVTADNNYRLDSDDEYEDRDW